MTDNLPSACLFILWNSPVMMFGNASRSTGVGRQFGERVVEELRPEGFVGTGSLLRSEPVRHNWNWRSLLCWAPDWRRRGASGFAARTSLAFGFFEDLTQLSSSSLYCPCR